MKQWVLKITHYAERLLEDLEGLDWTESIKDMQRNWIGKSEGALINFKSMDQMHHLMYLQLVLIQYLVSLMSY